jgi:Holliday junction resolvase RusA-like endonuclease
MESKSEIKDYLTTPAGRLAGYRVRRRKQVLLIVEGVEPRSKKMSEAERAAFQAQVAEQLEETKRTALRGPIALRVRLATTHRTPPQVHSIVKNLLDLLGRQGSTDKDWQKKRLYKDDSQIQALSVSCVHGETRPSIAIAARQFSHMVDDIELAAHAIRGLDATDSNHPRHEERDQEWIASFKRLIEEEAEIRAGGGDDLYEARVRSGRGYAQRAFLGQSAISIPVLAWLYGRPKGPLMQPLFDPWPAIIRQTGLRIQLGELPARTGDSSLFKTRIDAALEDFERRWGWLIRPLVVSVGLQVIVQPNASTPARSTISTTS